MNLSKRSEYALRALIDLGLARELGRPILQVSELASKEKLPIKFLEQILTQLRVAGYVETKRGKHGGYALAKPASRIKLGAVIRLLDGPLAPIACVSQTAYERCTCPDEAHCGLRMLMLDVRNSIARILDRATLGQIVEITLRKMRRDKVTVPFARLTIMENSTPDWLKLVCEKVESLRYGVVQSVIHASRVTLIEAGLLADKTFFAPIERFLHRR